MSVRIPADVLATTYSFREVAEDVEAIWKEHEGEAFWMGGTYEGFTGIAPLTFTESVASECRGWAERVVEERGDDVANEPCIVFLAAPVNEALADVWGAVRKLGIA